MLAPDPDEREGSLTRHRKLAAETQVPITFGFVATRNAGRLLDFLDDAASEGGRFIAQTHCRGISVLLSFKTRVPFDLLPAWSEFRARPEAEQLRALRDDPDAPDAVDRRRARRRLQRLGRRRRAGPAARLRGHPGVRAGAAAEPDRSPTMARERGVHPVEAMVDLAVESDFEQLFIQPSLYPQDEEVLLRALRHPRAVMTFSDSGAHLSQIADSSIHTHLLGYWVRDRQEFTLEEAVRMITLAPALAWGFADRGLVREGMARRPQRVRPRHRRPGGARAGRRPARPAAAAWCSGRSGSSRRSSAARSRSTTASPPAPPPAACVRRRIA